MGIVFISRENASSHLSHLNQIPLGSPVYFLGPPELHVKYPVRASAEQMMKISPAANI